MTLGVDHKVPLHRDVPCRVKHAHQSTTFHEHPPMTVLSSATPRPCTAASSAIMARSKRSAKRSGFSSVKAQTSRSTAPRSRWTGSAAPPASLPGSKLVRSMKAGLASGRMRSRTAAPPPVGPARHAVADVEVGLAEREVGVHVRGRQVQRDVRVGLRKCPRRGISHSVAKLGAGVHVQCCDALPHVVGGRPDGAQRPGHTLQIGSPAGLSRTPCAMRSNSRTPKSSSRATWWLMAEAVRCSSAAASAKLRRRATASKACKDGEGRQHDIGLNYCIAT